MFLCSCLQGNEEDVWWKFKVTAHNSKLSITCILLWILISSLDSSSAALMLASNLLIMFMYDSFLMFEQAAQIKTNILGFSGFVWHGNDEARNVTHYLRIHFDLYIMVSLVQCGISCVLLYYIGILVKITWKRFSYYQVSNKTKLYVVTALSTNLYMHITMMHISWKTNLHSYTYTYCFFMVLCLIIKSC